MQDLLLREFDSIIDKETVAIRELIEDQIIKCHPLFGEETGDFIDFTGWAVNSAQILKINILEVKPPKIGHLNPSEVIAEI